MNKEHFETIEQSIQKNFAEGIPFPEQVKMLMGLGVDRYYTDLIALQNTYYTNCGSSYTAKLPYASPCSLGSTFSQTEVIDAIRASQRGSISYPEFLNRIAKAGELYRLHSR
jgi:uncharacterized protein YbcV (DUF1398 family)